MPRALGIGIVLTVATVAVYIQVGGFDFVDYDDNVYVTENEHVHGGLSVAGVRWAFTTGREGNWHPLTWLSHMLDFELSGLDPTAHHLSSLVLHVANALLLLSLLFSATGRLWPSALAAALFALHPLNVESVAWVAERKNVLSMTLGLLATLNYVAYARRGGTRPYVLAGVFLALSLMAKPMLVTLPFVFLLLDYWPLERTNGTKRLGKLLLEKLPLLGLSLASSIVTLIVQSGSGAVVATVQALPLTSRLANALVSYVRYLRKMVWPDNLAIQYPHPDAAGGVPWSAWQVLGAAALLVAVSVAVAAMVRRRYLIVGWLWFVGTLVPVIGLVQVGEQAMADRYAYLPLIGLFIALAWGVADLLGQGADKRPFVSGLTAAAILAILSAYAVATWRQARYWRDSVTLYERGLEVSPRSAFLHFNLGTVLDARGRFGEAIDHYERALEIRPDRAKTHWGLANALRDQGRIDDAISHYGRALSLDPLNAEVHYDLANVIRTRGDLAGAVDHYERAIEIRPDLAGARNNLGTALLALGATERAIQQFTAALKHGPGMPEVHNNLGAALIRRGHAEQALVHFREAARSSPDWPVPLASAALILATHVDAAIRDPQEAVLLARKASSLTGDRDPMVLDTLAAAYAADGQFSEALSTARTALELAVGAGRTDLADEIRGRIELYTQGKPHLEPFEAEP